MSDFTNERYYQVTDEQKKERQSLLIQHLASLACMIEATEAELLNLETEMEDKLF